MATKKKVTNTVPEVRQEKSEDSDFQLWKEYKRTKDPEIRQKLIMLYAPFVKYVAGRLAMNLPPNVEVDDLIGYGIFGLVDAIEKFEPERNVRFKTYAQTRIRGAILDELRNLDWTPRSVRQKARKLESAYIELEGKLGRSATDEEVARHLNIDLEELHKLFNDTRGAFLFSLDEVIYNEDEGATRSDFISDEEEHNPESKIERKELRRMLVEALQSLTERERMVLTLYYFEELTLKEIGAILEVSDSRVSQLHTKAILRLKSKLARLQAEMTE